MSDEEQLRTTKVGAVEADDIFGAFARISPMVPKEYRWTLQRIKLALHARYGERGLYERCNGRSVAEIMATYGNLVATPEIASGTVDGKSYRLYESINPASDLSPAEPPPTNEGD